MRPRRALPAELQPAAPLAKRGVPIHGKTFGWHRRHNLLAGDINRRTPKARTTDGKRWGDPGSCDTPEELQRQLLYADAVQREAYPSVGGLSRAAAYPGLRHSGRRYSRRWEDREWDVRRVLEHLAGYVAVRRVDKNGKVSLYHRPHYVGTLHRGKRIYVMVDPQRGEWVFADLQGRQLRSIAAEELTAERIRSLTVAKRD